MKKLSLLLAFVAMNAMGQTAYKYDEMETEKLGRGLVCVRDNDSLVISWRVLRTDVPNTTFDVYVDGKKISRKPLKDATFLKIKSPKGTVSGNSKVELKTLVDGKTQATESFALNTSVNNGYLSIPLDVPADGVTPNGKGYGYRANDATVADVDGDGEYEVILKWDPTDSHDNSQEGFTGNVFIDCYKLGVGKLWRIDMGKNIRAGAHYTQMLAYDFDGDGKAELMVKTADGTVDGTGKVIGDANADYRFDGEIQKKIDGKMSDQKVRISGRILEGPEYLTVFSGQTGAALATTDYIPARGDVSAWGDSYGNRCDRFLAAIGYLDGKHPSAIFCRGYYTRTVLAAWDYRDGKLTSRWVFDTNDDAWRAYAGQGNHNLRACDVDGDGCDEITYGSMAVDHNGTGLYNTRMGHGDALHLMQFDPKSPRLMLWDVHENKRDGSDLRDARTGEILFQIPSHEDVGRGMAADIDPTHPGVEFWSATQPGFYDINYAHHDTTLWIPQNSAVWWDGDCLRELLDKTAISKYDWQNHKVVTLKDFKQEGCAFNNGTKQNPCLSADILGDWREEVLVRTEDSRELRIYTTTIPTNQRYVTWMQNIPYRLSVATENVGYNQPPEQDFYFGE